MKIIIWKYYKQMYFVIYKIYFNIVFRRINQLIETLRYASVRVQTPNFQLIHTKRGELTKKKTIY